MTNRLQLASVVDTFTTPPLQMLVIQTAWANRQLFAALRAVEAFETQKGADLIVRALDHIHVVRAIFQAHLQGKPHGYDAPQRKVIPSLAELDREFENLDDWFISTAGSFRSDELARPCDVRFTDGKIVTMTPATMILHAVTHTIHHRGNIDVIMLQAGMARRRDGFPDFLVSRASAT